MTSLEELKEAPLSEQYELTDTLWRTSESVVYKARQKATGKFVTVKSLLVLPMEMQGIGLDKVTARFLREIRLLSKLESPYILRLIDAGLDLAGLPYLVTEFVEGELLHHKLEEEGPLSPQLAHLIASQVLEALVEAHDLGIIHRDLKPENIILASRKGRTTARLLGFDIAGVEKESRGPEHQKITVMGERRGTLGYMAPELMQFFADPHPPSDIYAVGLILYECLTGKRAFSGTAGQITNEQMGGPLELPAVLTETPFAKIIAKACKRVAAERYSSAADMLDALEATPRRKLTAEPLTPGASALNDSHHIPLDEQYELLEEIGRGGFGVVYKARQRATGQLVAIKKMLDDPGASSDSHRANVLKEFETRFWREVKLIGQLRSPYTVRLIGAGFDERRPYMVLEFIDGITLDDLLEEKGLLQTDTIRRVFGQVLEALTEAHERGIVHRDMKPANIMLTGTGDRITAKVLDFGLAGIVEDYTGEAHQKVSRFGQARGTPSYIAPEQLINFANARVESDIYSLGLILFECILGHKAVDGETGPVICQKQLTQPVEIPTLLNDAGYGLLVDQACQKNPDKRFLTADAMRQALLAIDEMKASKTLDKSGLYKRSTSSKEATRDDKSNVLWQMIAVFLIVFSFVLIALRMLL